MSNSEKLRETRKGTIINVTSKENDKTIIKAIRIVTNTLNEKYPEFEFTWSREKKLSEIVCDLNKKYPNIGFKNLFKVSSLRPDGGILYIKVNGEQLPILISEMKSQGTNKKRLKEGLKKQSKGNAIERLGKNVRGFQMMTHDLDIFPFICFGSGCDFEDTSTILDRVMTISLFIELNQLIVRKIDLNGQKLSVGSYFFREESWDVDEILGSLLHVCEESISYYKEKGLI
jgi:type II restriction enzyme